MSFETLEAAVIEWSKARKIIPNSTPQAQLLKAFEEMGELAAATARGQRDLAADAVGDVLVCLINYCALYRLMPTACLASAYSEIKDRTGTMTPEGVFVKDDA
jgi:NTP pyrophosphatase (non-canonical NTP hydrolase)